MTSPIKTIDYTCINAFEMPLSTKDTSTTYLHNELLRRVTELGNSIAEVENTQENNCPNKGTNRSYKDIKTISYQEDEKGTLYIGTFVEGKLHGQGKVIKANGMIYVGEFSHGRLVKAKLKILS